ncbi:MAG TPA: DM13 domain-containing protein [Candidatus Thermoplasmatota archaeon]
MKRSYIVLIVAAAVVAILALIFVSMSDRFLPEKTQNLSEAAPGAGEGTGASGMPGDTMMNATVLSEGTWGGKAGHSASGHVELLRVGEQYYLRFEDFEMTSGPMVYLYLTPSADGDTEAEIDAGVRILIDGGADGGEATKRGTFNQILPAGLDITKYHGVAAWCDDFSVPFGTAALA